MFRHRFSYFIATPLLLTMIYVVYIIHSSCYILSSSVLETSLYRSLTFRPHRPSAVVSVFFSSPSRLTVTSSRASLVLFRSSFRPSFFGFSGLRHCYLRILSLPHCILILSLRYLLSAVLFSCLPRPFPPVSSSYSRTLFLPSASFKIFAPSRFVTRRTIYGYVDVLKSHITYFIFLVFKVRQIYPDFEKRIKGKKD